MANYYLYFKRIHKGYYDPRTGLLVSPQGKKNKEGVDPFESGGWAEPDLAGFEVLARYAHGNEVIVLINTSPSTYLTANASKTYTKTRKMEWVNGKKKLMPSLLVDVSPSAFSLMQLKSEEAKKKLLDWGFENLIIEESGVTN